MRIGVNALYLLPGGVGGTEIYLRSLLSALAEIDCENTYVVFTNRETGEDLTPAAPNFQWAPTPVRARFRPARILWEQSALPCSAFRRRIDVLFNPGFTCPVVAPCKQVTVFHDLQHKRHPEYFRWFDLPFWRLFLYLAAVRSDLLIAVSEATRQDLLHYYRLKAGKVRVVAHGADPRMFEIGQARAQRECDRYILCVSTLHAHKNITRLLAAFRRFHSAHPGFRLVLAGMKGFHTAEVERAAGELGLGDAVRITGWVDRGELYRLFEGAWAFVYPSSFEGFGMPVIEALAAGIPTACSAIEPLRTISGSAALHFDPLDEDAILQALVRVTQDEHLRERLARAGPQQASRFRWQDAARATLDVLREAAGSTAK